MCGCDLATVSRLEESFKSTLQQQASLESWAGWLEGVAESILRYEMILSYQYFIIVKLSSSSAPASVLTTTSWRPGSSC